jgi:hypothetical protein
VVPDDGLNGPRHLQVLRVWHSWGQKETRVLVSRLDKMGYPNSGKSCSEFLEERSGFAERSDRKLSSERQAARKAPSCILYMIERLTMSGLCLS